MTHADLSGLVDGFINEIVVDPHGNAYVNGGDFDFLDRRGVESGFVALVHPDGSAAAGGRQHRVRQRYGHHRRRLDVDRRRVLARRLSAFDIGADGGCRIAGSGPIRVMVRPTGLHGRRGAVWYADVPNKRCVRVREGGEVLQMIELDRGGFACLGGPDGDAVHAHGRVGRHGEHRRLGANRSAPHCGGARTGVGRP